MTINSVKQRRNNNNLIESKKKYKIIKLKYLRTMHVTNSRGKKVMTKKSTNKTTGR